MKSGVGCVLWSWWNVVRLAPLPSCSSFICLCCPLVDRSQSWQHFKPCTGLKQTGTAHDGHFFTAAISKFIEIDWFLQIIVKLILPLNMKLERGFSDPNIKTGGSWLAVKMFLWSLLSTEKKKNICTRALKSAKKQNRCKNRTDIFFWLFHTFCYKHRFMIIINIKSVSYWTIFPMKINRPQASIVTFYKSKTLWNLRERK